MLYESPDSLKRTLDLCLKLMFPNATPHDLRLFREDHDRLKREYKYGMENNKLTPA
jgi:hypothetical protein